MDVFFETHTGYTFSIEVGYWDTILEIKQKIEKYEGIPVSKQTLYFNGNLLVQADLEHRKVCHNSRLTLFDVSPGHNPNHNNGDQVLQAEQSPPSNSVKEIIDIPDSPVSNNKNDDQVLHAEQSPPSNSTREIIIIPDSPVRIKSNNKNDDQDLHTEQSPPSNSGKEIIDIPDSPVKSNSNNKNDDQVLQIEQSPPSNSTEQIINGQDLPVTVGSNDQLLYNTREITNNIQDSTWKPVKVTQVPMKMTVCVLPYSGERKKIWVDVKSRSNVEELRIELVKIQQRGEIDLPQEGYFFLHKKSKMVEDQTFWWNGFIVGDIIKIYPQHMSQYFGFKKAI